MKTAMELLQEVKAEDELIQRGWKQESCSGCAGNGANKNADGHYYPCALCYGVGYKWNGPITK